MEKNEILNILLKSDPDFIIENSYTKNIIQELDSSMNNFLTNLSEANLKSVDYGFIFEFATLLFRAGINLGSEINGNKKIFSDSDLNASEIRDKFNI